MDETLLTQEQARTFLNVSQPTFRRMIARGDIPAIRIGQRLIRIRKSDLENILKPVTDVRILRGDA